jgi:L-2,4-diaminobutyrate decarboxylase
MDYQAEARAALAALEAYERDSLAGSGRVLTQLPIRELGRALDLNRLMSDGGLKGGAFRNFLNAYLANSTRLAHPGAMAHQVAVPHPMGAIGALIDGFTNNAMAIYEMGPAAAAIEYAVIDWMLGKTGWKYGGGVLTHGGSLANLTALMAARGRVDQDGWQNGIRRDLVVIAPPSSHYSIARAMGIMGMGRQALRPAPVDQDGRIIPDALDAQLAALREEGRTVLAVIANACSTAVGLYDRLRDIAAVCQLHGAWLHVDGAHGASALLSDRLRTLMDGIECADSLTWDAHKMLQAPTLCAAVLVRDQCDLDRAFEEEASYLFHDKDQPGIDFIHRTVECTKAALGLRFFLVLAAEGEGGLARHVERQTELAREAAALIRRTPGFTVAVEPESNIVCFRTDGSDATQLDIRRRLLDQGEYYISTTEFRSQRWLRLALMNPATTMGTIERLLAAIAAA